MLVLGIETSCDETGVALYDSEYEGFAGLLAHAVYSQVAMHNEYGGVVPELASRDHIRRLLPLCEQVLLQAGRTKQQIDVIACTQGPGLAGALLTGAAFAHALGLALQRPVIGIHHLEGHLLSPLLSVDPPDFPFVALLVSGGHTQLMCVEGIGKYSLLGETLDDAAGECFDKVAKLLGLPYPGGPAIARLAEQGESGHYKLPRPMLHSGTLDFSFAGLKTAVLTLVKRLHEPLTSIQRANLARDFVEAIVDVLVQKSLKALAQTGLNRLVVAGGVGANRQLRIALNDQAGRHGYRIFYPEPDLCTDNGAMIALAGALRLNKNLYINKTTYTYNIYPRWSLNQN